MFDIGFFELVVISVIALLVLGPERLPHAVRMTGAWIGKFRRAAMSVREEIEREVNAHEVQQRLKQQLENSGMQEAKDALEETKQRLRNGILDDETLQEIEKRGLKDYTKALTEGGLLDSDDLADSNEPATDQGKKTEAKNTPPEGPQKVQVSLANKSNPPAENHQTAGEQSNKPHEKPVQ
ncbi:MAG: Sec-independent protein translocase protein TatB [Pseudomonadales bacterium]|nr:Sec-independent protein translocase protein TatB [Pseudomonadales bacterium]